MLGIPCLQRLTLSYVICRDTLTNMEKYDLPGRLVFYWTESFMYIIST